MTRRLVLIVFGLLVASACAPVAETSVPVRPSLGSEAMPVTTEAVTTTVDIGPTRAELTLASLTLEEKIGQLLMPVFAGSDATEVSGSEARSNESVFGVPTPAEAVSRYKLGGVIYLGSNILSADQVGAFSSGLQEVARNDTGIGLLVAVDQEGGRVSRLTDGVTVFPAAASLAGDVEAVREAGYLTGQQVAVQGINVVLAPVADIAAADNSGAIGNRSYGEDPDLVADMVVAAIDGLEESGVASAVKHWPGHGSTQVDSHVKLPELDISRSAWEARERVPFEAAIDRGVSIVLVGHLAWPAFEPTGEPATISSRLIDQLLRQELGFSGVVMTDALNMGAVSGIDPATLVVQAVAAGADILLVPPDLAVAYDALLGAVADDTLTEARIDEAALRVLSLKDGLGLLPNE